MRSQEFNCSKCSTAKMHSLRPSAEGASWVCTECGTAHITYSHKDILRVVSKFRINPNREITTNIPAQYRVFLEYQGADADEMEVDSEAIKLHVQLTNELPIVGKPLFTKGFTGPDGLCFVIPYGKVVRVEE